MTPVRIVFVVSDGCDPAGIDALYNMFGSVIEKQVCAAAGVKKRGPRGPTAYNTFISNTLRDIALVYPEMPRNDRMRMAQERYREHKKICT